MRNPLSLFYRWLHYVLMEETSDPHAPNAKPRKMLHNAHLIQAWAAMAGILSIGSIPLIIFLIQVPFFVVGYLCFCAVAGTAELVGHAWVKRLNERDYAKTATSASDLNSTTH